MMRTTFPSRRMSSKSSKLNQSRYVLQPFSLSLLMHKCSWCDSQGCWRRQLKGDGSAVHGSVLCALCVRWWVVTLHTFACFKTCFRAHSEEETDLGRTDFFRAAAPACCSTGEALLRQRLRTQTQKLVAAKRQMMMPESGHEKIENK